MSDSVRCLRISGNRERERERERERDRDRDRDSERKFICPTQ